LPTADTNKGVLLENGEITQAIQVAWDISNPKTYLQFKFAALYSTVILLYLIK